MADFNQFGSAKPAQAGDSEHCARCEAMLADVLDGTLSAADRAAFDLHMASCGSCSDMLADARRGVAWLEMLKSPRPEPPAALLERIIAQTCNQPSLVSNQRKPAHSAWQPGTLLGHPAQVSSPAFQPPATYGSAAVLPFRSRIAAGFRLRSIGQTLLQPRLAMTAAMAFFSIALTLNLTGVRVSSLRLSNLGPSSLKRNFYEANAQVLRYYDNLKVVYELESRVRDLQRSNGDDDPYRLPSSQNAPAVRQNPQQPAPQNPSPQKPDSRQQSRPKPGPGSSRRETPSGNMQFAGFVQRQDALPATQVFVVFSPGLLKCLQEGELV